LHTSVLSPVTRLRWQPMARWPRQCRPDSRLSAWLADSGSLTAGLITLSGGDFRVEVQRQHLAIPHLSEQRALGMRRPLLAMVREVVLIGEGKPWVFARSLLPVASLCGKLRHLRKQTNRPLGAFLFSQPHLQRSAISIARINDRHGYVPARLSGGKTLWGRRSVFYLDTKPLLVSEVFLPEFCNRIRPHHER
jgi:chorismate--pyruvate lyase